MADIAWTQQQAAAVPHREWLAPLDFTMPRQCVVTYGYVHHCDCCKLRRPFFEPIPQLRASLLKPVFSDQDADQKASTGCIPTVQDVLPDVSSVECKQVKHDVNLECFCSTRKRAKTSKETTCPLVILVSNVLHCRGQERQTPCIPAEPASRMRKIE